MNDLPLARSQIGIPYVPQYMIFATFHLNPAALHPENLATTYEAFLSVARESERRSVASGRQTMVVISVALDVWGAWTRHLEPSAPLHLDAADLAEMEALLSTSPPYCRTGGHFYFHVKSATGAGCEEEYEAIRRALEPLTRNIELTRGNNLRENRVYGRRILHGLIQLVDAVNLSARALIGDDDPAHKGGCFCLTQRFIHDWTAIKPMSELELENMIGRDHRGNLIPNTYERSHMKLARVLDEHGLPYSILTQGQQFGNAPSGHQNEVGVYVSAYAQSLRAHNAVLRKMVGRQSGFIMDEHLTISRGDQGNVWYVPTAAELGLEPVHEILALPIHSFYQKRSANDLMYYNTMDFLHRWGRQAKAGDEPLSTRIIGLLGNTFSRWRNNWYHHREYPNLGHLRDHLHTKDPDAALRALSIPERKGLTIKIMLGEMLTGGVLGQRAGVFRIDPMEIIVGVVPPFTLGTGVRVMAYLTEDEHVQGFLMGLDETSMAGHIVPDYETLLAKGIGALLREAQAGLERTREEDEKRQFYQSVVYSLQGVQSYFRNYAGLAKSMCDALPASMVEERINLAGIADRMMKLSEEPPSTFLEAAQLIFAMHCCYHLVGELVSLGRLDQLLFPFFKQDGISEAEAQEIIDAFWIKMDEQVLLNRQYMDDFRTFGTCAVPYTGGAQVPQGDKASQWVMQVTLGGSMPTDGAEPADASNVITKLCLRASRRLPVNAPCLNLRVSPSTPDDVLREASLALLAGGAGPTLMSDHDFVRSLNETGERIPLRHARDFCADGCWEPIVAGRSEFALTYMPVMNALEAALNRGATYSSAGSTYLRGSNISFPSPKAETIRSFEGVLDVFYRHYRWLVAQAIDGLVSRYGNLWRICPSPLLSSLVDGCMESGRDLTNGGARYHFLSPQIFGITCAIDSLWAIKTLVFEPATAVTTLPELRDCLICDWGHDMMEPLQNKQAGAERASLQAQRYKQLRQAALALPKLGTGNAEVDAFGGQIASELARIVMRVLEDPESIGPAFAAKLANLKKNYDLPGRRFELKLSPGFGTFEDYHGLGLTTGASADGRRKGTTLSSNFSPMPAPADLPPDPRPRDIGVLAGWNGSSFDYARNFAGPVDIDIREDFSQEKLVEIMKRFGRGEVGFNLLTISCANLEAMADALQFPEQYDLLRLRMGGWSEFFILMYPEHQQQHLRRPRFA